MSLSTIILGLSLLIGETKNRAKEDLSQIISKAKEPIPVLYYEESGCQISAPASFEFAGLYATSEGFEAKIHWEKDQATLTVRRFLGRDGANFGETKLSSDGAARFFQYALTLHEARMKPPKQGSSYFSSSPHSHSGTAQLKIGGETLTFEPDKIMSSMSTSRSIASPVLFLLKKEFDSLVETSAMEFSRIAPQSEIQQLRTDLHSSMKEEPKIVASLFYFQIQLLGQWGDKSDLDLLRSMENVGDAERYTKSAAAAIDLRTVEKSEQNGRFRYYLSSNEHDFRKQARLCLRQLPPENAREILETLITNGVWDFEGDEAKRDVIAAYLDILPAEDEKSLEWIIALSKKHPSIREFLKGVQGRYYESQKTRGLATASLKASEEKK